VTRTSAAFDRKAVGAWCLFDWANSAFTTLVVTYIYSTYFTRAIAPDEVRGTALWSRGLTMTALLVATLSPIFGAAADRRGTRLRFLATTTAISVLATIALTFVAPGAPHAVAASLLIFVVANVAFEMGMVFYNALLPGLVPEAWVGRISGYGWGLGYLGGLACLVLALVGFVQPETPWFGISTADGFNVRATNLLVAVWFAVFAVPTFFAVREPPTQPGPTGPRAAFAELARTAREIGRFRETAKFLLARLIYNDGLVTIFAFGGIYAAGTFGMEFDEILVFGIALNIAAGLGAFAFGAVDDKIGGKATVLVSVVALTIGTAVAVWAPTRTWLWVAGITIGIFAGPNQAASRSLMARFTPTTRQGEFFGLFAFSGKLTSFLGPLFLGIATQAFASQRVGVAALLVFFIVGGSLLATVDEPAGIAAAREQR